MEAAKVREYIVDFQKGELPQITPRELEVEPKTTLINTIIGPRRAGKTYYLYQLMRGIPKQEILYLNFEDIRLVSVTFKEFLDIINIHTEITNTKPSHIFLDEPQVVMGWEKGVRTLLDQHKFKIVLTGSSSKLLSKELATQLRGRTITHLLLPYSFSEFLAYNGFHVPKVLSSEEKAKIRSYLDRWLEWGGYPDVVKTESTGEKMKILDGYRELIIYKDVVERYGIKTPFLAKLLIEHLVSSFSKEFSVNAFFNLLKSRSIKVSKKTLYNYLSLIEDSVAIFLVEKYSPKLKEQKLSPKKVYLCDTALAYRQRHEKAKLMENMVFLQLKRMQNLNPELGIYYWKNHQHEVDFVIKEGQKVRKAIQVTYAESRAEVQKREVKGLLASTDELKPKELEIITWNYEGVEVREGKKITFIPLWKWLLHKKIFH